jgi:hypothetical protein
VQWATDDARHRRRSGKRNDGPRACYNRYYQWTNFSYSGILEVLVSSNLPRRPRGNDSFRGLQLWPQTRRKVEIPQRTATEQPSFSLFFRSQTVGGRGMPRRRRSRSLINRCENSKNSQTPPRGRPCGAVYESSCALAGCGKMQEHRHSGARALPASPESRNTDQRNQWLGQCSWFPGGPPPLTGRPGMTREFSAAC